MASAAPAPQDRLAIAVFVAAVLVACAGWQLMWFLTDDAYISFRYLSNALRGYGLVWNPPPFQPVEGYISALEQPPGANQHPPSIHGRLDALAGYSLKAFRFAQNKYLLLSRPHDGLAQGML